MKSMIVVLALLGGAGIGATEASAGDAENLSCITEINKAGHTVRDCNKDREPRVYAQVIDDESEPDSAVPLAIHDGGPNQDHGERPRR